MTTTPTSPARRAAAGASLLLALVALATGCTSAGSGDAGSAAGESAPAADAEAAADGAERATSGSDLEALSSAYDAGGARRTAGDARGVVDAVDAIDVAGARRAVVSTGTVSLESDDVSAAVFDVRRVVDEAGGEVSDEQTGTDRDGEVRRSRLVLRVPAAAFDEALAALKQLDGADLRSAKQVSEDVTTQVIDVAARVRAQEASLARVELLFARAERLRDVVAIEAQLSRRQAELDSLKQQQAYLADQTTLATITVLVEQPAPDRAAPETDDGFVSGLAAGWDALQGSTVAVLTAVGAVLPFLVVLALLGVPAWLLVRRWAPHRAAPLSEGAAARTP